MRVPKSLSGIPLSSPQYLDEAAKINAQLKKLSLNELADKMKLSPNLAQQTYDNIQRFGHQSTSHGAAILSYSGDVYKGLMAETLSPKQLLFAQDHVFILSGHYGILRPLDDIHPYRLEMGLSLKVGNNTNLYKFWGKKLADTIQKSKTNPIINLLSEEYFSAIGPYLDSTHILNIHFRESINGKLQLKSAFAKKARGLMCRFGIENKIAKKDQLKNFDVDGYRFMASASDKDNWYFVR
ncbi:MAG: YaaA family protein [Saprospiraceae bacterium]|nr:YaaA family protein [Saprospiraceae bacterium]MBK8110358.1 YaaA family protein [Saprospiraceae bacterium]MBL0081325.1 YaaA family protein [Saprospiraceae bacterium]